MTTDWTPIITALGGGTGISAGLVAFGTVIRLLRRGVSPREGKRKVDIVQQRDEALLELAATHRTAAEEKTRADHAIDSAERAAARADAELTRADWADENRQIAVENEQRSREHAADLRFRLVDGGLAREQLPPWPRMEDPIPRSELNRRILELQKVKHPTVDDEPEFYKTQTRAEIDAERWRPNAPDLDLPDSRRPRH